MKKNQILFLVTFLFLAAAQSTAVASILENRIRAAEEVVRNRQTSNFPIPGYVIDATKCVAPFAW